MNTQITSGDVYDIIKLLEDYCRVCWGQGETGPIDNTEICTACEGRGKFLTTEGEMLLAFLGRYWKD
jgi:hypothetical protein